MFGEQVGGGSGFNPGPSCADLVLLQNTGPAGDYVQLIARQDTGSAVSTAGNPFMSVRWVAPVSGVSGLAVPVNAAWPVPPAYVTSSFLNSSIRDAIRYLTYPPVFRGYYQGSGNTLASTTWPAGAAVPLDTANGAGSSSGGSSLDPYAGWNAAGNYWQAPVAGVYSVYVQAALAATASAYQLGAGFAVNGTTQWLRSSFQPASTSPRAQLAMRKVRLSAGDQVQARGFQNSGSALSLVGSGTNPCYAKMIIIWEAA